MTEPPSERRITLRADALVMQARLERHPTDSEHDPDTRDIINEAADLIRRLREALADG